jgi:hypothetical protein
LTYVPIPEGVLTIGKAAFAFRSLVCINIPVNVTFIDSIAFYQGTKLEDLTFDSVGALKTIGAVTFEDCTSLLSMHLPEGLETIGYNGLRGLTKIKNVVFLSTMTSVGTNVMEGCYPTSVTMSRSLWESQSNQLPAITLRLIGESGVYSTISGDVVLIPKTLEEVQVIDKTEATDTAAELEAQTTRHATYPAIATAVAAAIAAVVQDALVADMVTDTPVADVVPDIPVADVVPDTPVADVVPDTPVADVISDQPRTVTIGSGGGDPYIRCNLTGTTIKLLNCCDVYRMYQNKFTGSVINCRVGDMRTVSGTEHNVEKKSDVKLI